MISPNANVLAADRINDKIDELQKEENFSQAIITESKIKGFLEISFLVGLISKEENEEFWLRFAGARDIIRERFKEHPAYKSFLV